MRWMCGINQRVLRPEKIIGIVPLNRLIEKRQADQEDDPDSWAQRWFRFAEDLAGDERPDPREPEAMRDWIDRACSGFAKRFSLMSEMVAAAERGSEP